MGTVPLTVSPAIGIVSSAMSGHGLCSMAGHGLCSKRSDSDCMCTLAWGMRTMLISSFWAGDGTFHSFPHLVPYGEVMDRLIWAWRGVL